MRKKINTHYILYVLKGLYIFGKNDSPFVLLGEKNDMKTKEPHIIFSNVGLSTTSKRNTKYFSFEMEKNNDNSEKTHMNKVHNDQENNKNKKEKFKLNLYKDNPYLRRKKDYENPNNMESYDLPELFLELIIMKENDFNKFYLPNGIDICCQTKEIIMEGDNKYSCPDRGFLKRFVDENNMYSLKLPVYFINDRIPNDSYSLLETDVTQEQFLDKINNNLVYNIVDTDSYALFLSNCIESKDTELDLHGNIHILNGYGYLPGDKIAKLNLYAICIIAYTFLILTWIYLLIKNKKVVIKIQIWILVCIFLYLMENFFLFIYFAIYNLYAKIYKHLLLMLVCSTVLKNVCSYLLILLGSLGWGLVVPNLDKKTSMKIKFLFFLFIIFDFIKQYIDLHFSDSQINNIYFFFCIFPVTIIYFIIYLWVFTSISKIIIQLNEDKQYEKLNMFKKFFNVLIFALIFSIISFFIDIMVVVYVNSTVWYLKSYLCDGISRFSFLIILASMMILFKPSDRIKRISHFIEIGDMDEMEDFSNFKNIVDVS